MCSMTTAHTPKQQAMKIVKELPEDSSYDDILRELAMARMIERGLADADAGRVISHEAMKRRLESWAK